MPLAAAGREVRVEEVPVTFSDEAANLENEECRDPQALKRPPPGQREASGKREAGSCSLLTGRACARWGGIFDMQFAASDRIRRTTWRRNSCRPWDRAGRSSELAFGMAADRFLAAQRPIRRNPLRRSAEGWDSFD